MARLLRGRTRRRDPPLRHELLFASPRQLDRIYDADGRAAPDFRRRVKKGVVPGEWDLHWSPIEEHRKQKACRLHFEDGVPWTDLDLFRNARKRAAAGLVIDGCRTVEDVDARYARLDELFRQAREEGRLRTCWELDDSCRGERRGIRVHLDRHGRFLFAGNGTHRLAIARILDLPVVPVGLMTAHPDAIRDGQLERLRNERARELAKQGLAIPDRALGLPPRPFAALAYRLSRLVRP